jgi:heme-degrading monooxygenase HmoA
MFVVMTKTFFDEDMNGAVIEISKRSLPIFKDQRGLIDIAMHLSHDNSHIMTRFVWDSKESHEACMASPDWEEINSRWGELITGGKAHIELNTYSLME